MRPKVVQTMGMSTTTTTTKDDEKGRTRKSQPSGFMWVQGGVVNLVLAQDQLGSRFPPAGRVSRVALHGPAVEHVQHGRIRRSTAIPAIGNEIIDAHARPSSSGGRGRRKRRRGGRRRGPVGRIWRWGLEDSGRLRGRIVVGGGRGGGSLRMGRRRGAAGFITVGGLGRGLARWLCSVVGLGRGRRRSVGG